MDKNDLFPEEFMITRRWVARTEDPSLLQYAPTATKALVVEASPALMPVYHLPSKATNEQIVYLLELLKEEHPNGRPMPDNVRIVDEATAVTNPRVI